MTAARVIAIYNRKGGVGKSETTINLAALLAEHGKRVLAIDCDSQSNTTLSCSRRYTPDETIYSIFDEPHNVRKAIAPSSHGFDLMMGDANLSAIERELGTQANHSIFAATLKPILGEYDFILIDLPPELGYIPISGLVAATEVLIPVQCEKKSTDGTEAVLSVIRSVQENLNPELKILGAFATMYQDYKQPKKIYEAAKQFFLMHGVRFFQTKVRRTVKYSEANEMREPAVLAFSKHQIVNDYRLLASEVFNL